MQARSNLIWNILKTSSPLEKQIPCVIETDPIGVFQVVGWLSRYNKTWAIIAF